MFTALIRPIAALLLVTQVSWAQTASPLPEKLQSLKKNYDAAVVRATAPLTRSYLQELQRLKLEYTRAGNLSAALTADALIKAASDSAAVPMTAAGDAVLSAMNLEQFKVWLSTVVIRELSGFKNTFTFDGKDVSSAKDGAAPRVHQNVSITVGKIFVPFTSTNATIQINSSRTRAEVSYSTGEKIDAKIEPRS